MLKSVSNKIVASVLGGLSYRQTGKLCGVSPATARYHALKAGIVSTHERCLGGVAKKKMVDQSWP